MSPAQLGTALGFDFALLPCHPVSGLWTDSDSAVSLFERVMRVTQDEQPSTLITTCI
jgi:hypothetical protein